VDAPPSPSAAVPCGPPPHVERMTGLWLKSADSDPMDPAIDALRLNFIMRKAVNLVNRLEITASADSVQIDLASAIPWFKVRDPVGDAACAPVTD
jgi:hypothetical protein